MKNNQPTTARRLSTSKLRNIRIPQSICFLSDVIEDETYASALSLGNLGFNSGHIQEPGSTELREHMVMSNLSGIEDIVEFDELETFRLREPEARKPV